MSSKTPYIVRLNDIQVKFSRTKTVQWLMAPCLKFLSLQDRFFVFNNWPARLLLNGRMTKGGVSGVFDLALSVNYKVYR